MKSRLSVLCLVLLACVSCRAEAEAPLPGPYEKYLHTTNYPEESLHQQTGFAALPCAPQDFARIVGETVQGTNAAGSRSFEDALAIVGFPKGLMPDPLRWGVPQRVETIEYGTVSATAGQQALAVVLTHMGGYRVAAVFLQDAAGWWLTDCLELDDYGIENTARIPLLTRDDGSAGAWLLARHIGHGTGYGMLFERWYNVLRRGYDVGYIREGHDEFARDERGLLYAVLRTDMDIDAGRLPAVQPFTTWISLIREPVTDGMILDDNAEELTGHIVTGQYAYDAQTASYRLENRTLHVNTTGTSPALAYYRSRW